VDSNKNTKEFTKLNPKISYCRTLIQSINEVLEILEGIMTQLKEAMGGKLDRWKLKKVLKYLKAQLGNLQRHLINPDSIMLVRRSRITASA